VLRLNGDSETIPKAMMAAFGVCFLLAAGFTLAATEGVLLGACVVALAGVSREFVGAAVRVGSDVPFCALVWMLLALSARPGGWRAGRTAAIAGLGVAAILFRALGVALVPAAVVLWLLQRRETGPGPLVAGISWVAAFVALSVALPVATSYAQQMTLGGPSFLEGLVSGLAEYRHAVLDALLYPFPWNPANDAHHLISVAVTLAGLAMWFRRSWRGLTMWFALAYGAIALVFPLHTTRYMLPLLPLFLVGFLRGVETIVQLVLRGSRGRRAAAVTVVAVALLVAGGIRSRVAEPSIGDLTEHASVQRLFAALRHECGTGVRPRIVFFNPRVLTWRTGIPAMGFFRAAPDDVISEICEKGITHVIVGDQGTDNPGSASITHAVDAHPGCFVRTFESAEFTAYRFDRGSCGDHAERGGR
jgi:hypothetical protein